MDGGSRVTHVEHKPDEPSGTTIAAEVFVYEPEALCRTLDDLRRELSPVDDGSTGLGDFGEHLLPRLIRDGTVHAWPLEGYWADLGTPSSFLAAHRDLLAGRVDAVGRRDWPVLTRWPELPAARVDAGAVLEDVVVSAGCRVHGTVRRSVLGPGVVVEAGAVVEDSVLFSGVEVGRDARVVTALLDENVRVDAGARVGEPTRATRAHDDHVAVVARDSVVGRGARIRAGARPEGARHHRLTPARRQTSGDDDDLVGRAVRPQRLQGGAAVVLEREAVRDQAVGARPARPQRRDRRREGADLGERALDGQLAPEHVVRATPTPGRPRRSPRRRPRCRRCGSAAGSTATSAAPVASTVRS